MRTSPLHEHFGIEIHDVDLRDVTAKRLYPEIRAAFEEHTLLLFRGQSLDAAEHRRIATLFGPPEDLTDAAPGATPARPMVSNLKDSGAVAAADDLQLLNLQANFIWHTDSTFLPTPAISNVLVACVLPDRGGNTEFASTRNGWAAMDPALRAAARDKVFIHRYAHSRQMIDPVLGRQEMFTKYPDQPWRSTWTNPLNQREALLIGGHVCAVVGMTATAGRALVDDLTAAVTRPEDIYSHCWRDGDVLIWDQRAALHRGQPWPYAQERTLASIVSSAVEADGIASAGVARAQRHQIKTKENRTWPG